MIRLKAVILVSIVLICSVMQVKAKEVKPTLLVYGDGIEAFAAALQAVRSNVPTIWVSTKSTYLEDLTKRRISVTSNSRLLGGIWKDILIETGQLKGKDDSLLVALQRDMDPQLLRNAIERMLSKERNLTLIQTAGITKVVDGKKDVTVTLSNKRKYKVRAMVDATEGGDTRAFVVSTDVFTKPARVLSVAEIEAAKRRTLVSIGEYADVVYGYTWSDLFARRVSNIFYTSGLVQVGLDDNSLPLRANLGQALGAAAGYCSFFKTTADKVDMRKLQTELLTFDARLLPWLDVSSSDVHFKSIQKIYLVSLLPAGEEQNPLVFSGETPVNIDRVKEVFNSLYSRSQLWFVDKKDGVFELKELLALIKQVSFRGDELDREVEKEWSRKLKFEGDYDPNHVVSRYEFAVLVDRYADPYAKAVDVEGKILR
ncbi:FAD-dependent oxidoreductase [Sphingobacterium paucimobilis]|nr:FAD-dependent oxidoreductase [Sphingobacterium paucimobilis]